MLPQHDHRPRSELVPSPGGDAYVCPSRASQIPQGESSYPYRFLSSYLSSSYYPYPCSPSSSCAGSARKVKQGAERLALCSVVVVVIVDRPAGNGRWSRGRREPNLKVTTAHGGVAELHELWLRIRRIAGTASAVIVVAVVPVPAVIPTRGRRRFLGTSPSPQ